MHLNKTLCKSAAANDTVNIKLLLQDPAVDPYWEDESHKNAFNYAANNLESLALLAEAAFHDISSPSEQRRWPDRSLDAPIGKLHASLSSYIVKACSPRVVQKMLAFGINLTVKDDDGWNLLHKMAVMPRRSEVLKHITWAMQEKGVLTAVLQEKTTRAYDTNYQGIAIHYDAQQTPLDLYVTRRKNDLQWAKTTHDYVTYLNPDITPPHPHLGSR